MADKKLILEISAKCSDMFCATLRKGEEVLKEYDGYVPEFFPGQHWGDYVQLDIDMETGMILNWKKPTQEQIDSFIDKQEDEV